MTDLTGFYKPNLNFYSLRSRQLDFFNLPFSACSDVEAVAAVRNAVLSGDIKSEQACDLELWDVGYFDTETGKFEIAHNILVDDISVFIKRFEEV